MTEKKQSQFKLNDIKEMSKQLTKLNKFYIDEEKTMFINYYPKFSKKKSHELFVDLSDAIAESKSRNIDFFSNDLELFQYAQFLIIKHFTSLKKELTGKSLDVHMETMLKLIETGLFDRFFNEMFDLSEVHDLMDELEKKAELGFEILRVNEETNAELAKKLQSDVLKREEG